MIVAVESYLAVRRAAGFTLSNTEYLLRSFAGFAADQKQTHIRTATAIDWASQAKSVAQRHTRHQTICRFPEYLRVEAPGTNCRRRTTSATGRVVVSRTFIHAPRSMGLSSPPRGFHRPTRCCPRRMRR